MLIPRTEHARALRQALRRSPVVALLGARQVGKTTLAREVAHEVDPRSLLLDLEDEADLSRLREPRLSLAGARGLVVIDEVQRRPDLFPLLRVLVDRRPLPCRFLVLGSASPDLLRQTSETLAGRLTYYTLPAFSVREVGIARVERLWLRGGFPRAFLARGDKQSFAWRRDFVRTFLERDIPQLGFAIPAPTLRRFWTMVAHRHGQLWNSSSFASSFGVSDVTTRRYLDLLAGALVLRLLLPWHENVGKRQVKAPKVYVADSGLLHFLLGLATREALLAHPVLGASWEGFAIQEVTQRLGAEPEECFFWRTHTGAELDLLVVRGRRRLGFEFKRTVSPTVTPSMTIALEDLKLDRLDVIHAGEHTFPLKQGIRAVAFSRLHQDLTKV